MKERLSLRPSAAAFLLMMAMSITTSALSFFVSPVCADLNIGRGSFTLYYSLMTASAALSTSFLGQYINRRGVRNIVLISGVWCACGLILFSFARSLWMFYLVAAAMGMFATSCVNLCANVIVQQSYTSAQASGLLGFVMAGSGVGGMLFSWIVPAVLERYGWQMGYRFLGLCWALFVLTAFFLLDKQAVSGGIGSRRTPISGMTREQAMRSPKLYLMMVIIMVLTACCGVQQQIPSMLGGMGFSTAQVSLMVSVMTAGLAIGKIAQGVLYSKIGITKGGAVMVAVFAAGFLLMLKKELVYPALLCLAFGMGVYTTLMPIATRFVFGALEYAAIWSVIATAGSVGSFVVTPVWGMIYDIFGSYTPALITAPVLLAVALLAMLAVFREQR